MFTPYDDLRSRPENSLIPNWAIDLGAPWYVFFVGASSPSIPQYKIFGTGEKAVNPLCESSAVSRRIYGIEFKGQEIQ